MPDIADDDDDDDDGGVKVERVVVRPPPLKKAKKSEEPEDIEEGIILVLHLQYTYVYERNRKTPIRQQNTTGI